MATTRYFYFVLFFQKFQKFEMLQPQLDQRSSWTMVCDTIVSQLCICAHLRLPQLEILENKHKNNRERNSKFSTKRENDR